MFFILLQDTAFLKDHVFFYNDQKYEIQYIHSTASEVPRQISYNEFDSLATTSQVCIVAHASTLNDVSVTIEYTKSHSFAVFGVGDFSMKNSIITFSLTGQSQTVSIAIFGRGVLDLSNGSINIKAGRSAQVMATYLGENLLFKAENFVMNFTVVDFVDTEFLSAVTYVYANNLSFVGTNVTEKLLYHAGLPVFSCNDEMKDCFTCDDHQYLKNGSCAPILESGMNCDGCIRGYVKGLKTSKFDDSLGCFEQVLNKNGENCYFGLDSAENDAVFKLRCGRCYDQTMDPAEGCVRKLSE